MSSPELLEQDSIFRFASTQAYTPQRERDGALYKGFEKRSDRLTPGFFLLERLRERKGVSLHDTRNIFPALIVFRYARNYRCNRQASFLRVQFFDFIKILSSPADSRTQREQDAGPSTNTFPQTKTRDTARIERGQSVAICFVFVT